MSTTNDALRPAVSQGGKNPIQHALEDYSRMERELALTKSENDRLRSESRALLSERNMYAEEAKKLRTERDRLQAYATNIVTRLDVIEEVIKRAKSESLQYSIKSVTSTQVNTEVDDGMAKLVGAMTPRTADNLIAPVFSKP